MKITRRALAASALALPLGANAARAQGSAWPQRPLTIVIGYTPGGAADVMARLVGQLYTDELKQPVLIENRPGAGSTVAAAAVARSPADGYTLLLNTAPDSVVWPLVKQVPYVVERDFSPIGLLCTVPSVLVVPADSPFRTVEELIAHARENPGKLNYGAFGYGSSAHMAAELFQSVTRTKFTYTPYQGSARAIVDLLTGRIDLVFDTFASASSHIQAGKLRALAVTTATRVPSAPNIPTMQEAGVGGYVSQAFIGLTAPSGIPADIRDRLEKVTQKVVNSVTFRSRVDDFGMIFAGLNAEKFREFLLSEADRNRKLIAEAKLVFE